jgi:hypothetical protein
MKRWTLLAAALLAVCASYPAQAQTKTAWFGLVTPKGLSAPPVAPSASVAAKIPKAAIPADEAKFTELSGARMKADIARIVSFADAMARTSQMYGRISGFPSEAQTAEWVGAQFKAAGLKDVAVQTYNAGAPFWWPNSWEVRVAADPAYGADSKDVVLGSAVPVSGSEIKGVISAPVVFVGEAGSVTTDGVAGKIVVEHTKPATGAYSERKKVHDSSALLIQAGAVAVLNWVEQGGNMHVFDFGRCGGPCFNIGGEDGRFLKAAIDKAAAAGAPPLKLSLKLDTSMKTGLTGRNVIGIAPGASPDILVVNAHLDSWFSGAGDNADGLAVMLALARHYGKPANKPAKTLLFVGSGGHHSPGMNGPGNLLSANAELLKRAQLVMNLEHLAQFEEVNVPAWDVHATEEPKSFGVSNMSPFLVSTVKAAAETYGFVIKPEITSSVPGDLGGYAPLNIARIQGIHSGPLYHTSGDTPASISTEGLTRAAHFYRAVIDAAGKASAKDINP